MKANIMNKMTRSLGKVKLKTMKYSPEILLVSGIVLGVTGAVMACKASTKLNDIMESHKDDIAAVNDAEEHPDNLPEEYTPADAKKDRMIIRAQTMVKLIKLYGPALAMGTLSVMSILASHNIIRKRNLGLAAAYASVDKAFKDYRKRVVDKFGKDLDQELRFDTHAEVVKEKVKDEDGKEKTVKSTYNVYDPDRFSGYARVYAEGCNGWTKDPSHNMWVLKSIQSQLNDQLKRDGFLFLNDAYEALGFQRTAEGQVVGWLYCDDNTVGDNFVDFGIFDDMYKAKENFINGYERNIILDFNVDGPIVNMM